MAAALADRGEQVRAFKPVVTGLDEPADPTWPPDHELLAAVTGARPGEVTSLTFGPAASPHLAAQLSGHQIEPAELLAAARRAGETGGFLIVEGVGGILVPLTAEYAVRDLARELALPVLIAARPGLGTINHTLLTLEAARAAGLTVVGVVLTPWPADAGAVERSNRDTIASLGAVDVAVLPEVRAPERSALVRAAAGLPLERWFG
jgi:dethiobiotin synthetase